MDRNLKRALIGHLKQDEGLAVDPAQLVATVRSTARLEYGEEISEADARLIVAAAYPGEA